MAGLVPSGNVRELPPDELEKMAVEGLSDDDGDEEQTIIVDPKTGSIIHMNPDGSAVIDTNKEEETEDDGEEEFHCNLAKKITQEELDRIGAEVIEGVEADLRTRSDFDVLFERAVDLLGIKMEAATSTASGEGTVSNVYHPLLLETVVRYQANFIAEMIPASGPVKIVDDTPNPVGVNGAPPEVDPADSQREELATAFEKDFNHYLTVVAKEFFPDTDRMAFSQGLFGNGFKKQFHCPLRRRPVTESIPMQDLIVSNNATDLDSALRVTHRTKLSKSVMKRMQLNGSYRKVDLPDPTPSQTRAAEKIGQTEGTDKTPQRQEDFDFEVYETMIDLDIKGFEHEEDGEQTGLPLPYIVTVDKDSRVVLAVRRNWKEDDEDCRKVMRIVHYPLIPGLGFYAYGFIHLLGNTSRALTGITRLLLDAGQFASFPGFLMAKGGSKQATNEIRVSPGTGKEIDTQGKAISDVIMALPYKEPSQTLEKMRETMAEDGLRLGGAAQIPVGEGRADVPVGTMMAAVEQITKVMGAVHKRNHAAMQQELINMRELFMEDPTSIWKLSRKPNRRWQTAEEFSDLDLTPASDPNVPSQIHRIMIATALIQLASSPTGQQLYNQMEVHERALRVLGVSDPTSVLKPPTPQGPDPVLALKQQELQLKQQDQQIKAAEQQREAQSAVVQNQMRAADLQSNMQNDAANRDHQLKMQTLKIASEHVKHQGQIAADARHEVSKAKGDILQQGVKGMIDHSKIQAKAEADESKLHAQAIHDHIDSHLGRQHEANLTDKKIKNQPKPRKAKPNE